MQQPHHWQGEDLLLECYIQPKASRDEFVGIHDDRLKIRISGAPVDGKANKNLCKFLAKQFAVPAKSVEVVRGETSRHKTLRIRSPQLLPEGWGLDWQSGC